MMESAPHAFRPNILAALPGRMVDEAPKQGGRDGGARSPKLIPTVLGFLGAIVVMVVLVVTDVLDLIVRTDGVLLYVVLLGIAAAIFVGMVIPFGAYTFLNLRTRAYTLYDDRVEMTEGFLKQEAKTVPYSRITNVTLRQNVWERLFDAGTVQLQTAGSDAAELWLRGIDDPEGIADHVRDRLSGFEFEGGPTDGT